MTPCIWDSDTLDTELRGLPDSFNLVVGRWHRHSDAYYQLRITKLGDKQDLTLAEYDDLAVAYERLKNRDKAIEVMARKAKALEKAPDEDHQYRYHANLGTFYAHSGKFDDALRELRTAVKINPKAHFGREHFQIELIEYVAAARANPELWRRRSFLRHAGYRVPMLVGSGGLKSAEYVKAEWDADWGGKRVLDWDVAHKAVGGMLRFGGLEGAELYRALGELYLAKEHLNLAWWSFGRALERGHPAKDTMRAVQKSIEKHWDEARPHNSTGHVNPTQDDYKKRRTEADEWLETFQKAEAAAIERGEDVSSEKVLQRLLREADGEVPPAVEAQTSMTSWVMLGAAAAVGVLALMLSLRLRGSR